MSTYAPRWTTVHELAFLARLGQHAQTGTPPRVLLRRYERAMHRRVDWGRIDRQRVVQAVATLLGRPSQEAV